MRLGYRLLHLRVVFLLFYGFLTGGWLTTQLLYTQHEIKVITAAWQKDGQSEAMLLQQILDRPFKSSDQTLLQNSVNRLGVLGGRVEVTIVNADNTILARSPGSLTLDNKLITLLAQRVFQSERLETKSSTFLHTYYYGLPLTSNSGQTTAVLVTKRNWETEYQKIKRRAKVTFWQNILLAIVVFLGIDMATGMIILAPVNALMQLIKKVNAGNLSERIQVLGIISQFHSLGLAFNKMLDTLELQQNELQQLNEELENRVQERTQQLQLTLSALQASKERYRAVVEQTFEGICLVDAKTGQIIEANSTYLNLLGYTKEEILELRLEDVVLLEPEVLKIKIEPIWSQKHLYITELQCRRQNSCVIDASASISLISYDNREVFCIVLHDTTERKQAELALHEANEKLRDWVSQLEQRTYEITLLSEMSEILQACVTIEEAYSALRELIQPIFPNISGGVYMLSESQHLLEAVATWGDASSLTSQKLFTPHECWAVRRGRTHMIDNSKSSLLCKHLHPEKASEYLCVPMIAQGETVGVLHLSAFKSGELSQAKQQLAVTIAEHLALALANLKLRSSLQHQSIRDPLTGLFNRRYLEESLERELHRAKRASQPLGIIMLDVDHFKHFNDTFGHEAGDIVLRELGFFLQQSIRGSDIACRYGGEEMILVLLETTLEVTKQRAEQIREAVKQLQVYHRRQPLGGISMSLGVACYPEHGSTGAAVIQAADAALYRAKREGRDRVVVALASKEAEVIAK
jgi:diguanylate cyclase (GGDEF)-like protein/PAS domain S-box-containing protein